MSAKLSLKEIGIAVVGGIVLGIAVAVVARVLGLSREFVGPLTGGVVGAFVPLIYRLRASRADRSPSE